MIICHFFGLSPASVKSKAIRDTVRTVSRVEHLLVQMSLLVIEKLLCAFKTPNTIVASIMALFCLLSTSILKSITTNRLHALVVVTSFKEITIGIIDIGFLCSSWFSVFVER